MRIRPLPDPGNTAGFLLISFHWLTKPFGGFPFQDSANPVFGVFDGGIGVTVVGLIRDLLAFSSRKVPIEVGFRRRGFWPQDWAGPDRN